MSLLEDLGEAEAANQHGRGCNLCTMLDQMEPEAAERVRAVVRGRTIGSEKLAAILSRNGYPAGRRAIKRHQMEDHQ